MTDIELFRALAAALKDSPAPGARHLADKALARAGQLENAASTERRAELRVVSSSAVRQGVTLRARAADHAMGFYLAMMAAGFKPGDLVVVTLDPDVTQPLPQTEGKE